MPATLSATNEKHETDASYLLCNVKFTVSKVVERGREGNGG